MEPITKSMNSLTIVLSILVPLFLAPIPCHSSSCTETFYTISDSSNKNITQCVKLTTLRMEFGWSYAILGNKWSKIDVVVGRRQRSDVRWLAWGVNPLKRPQMVGTRAIIAIRQWNESMEANTYYITNETKRGCHLEPSRIDVEVKNPTSHYSDENGIRYFALSATIILPPSYDISKLNHVWQVGYEFEGTQPGMHRTSLDNFDSWGTINLETGGITGLGQHQRYLRKMHGILNIIGWGAVLPIGVIIARYFREHPFSCKSSWYYLHVAFQSVGYMLGTAGWALGMSLGRSSRLYRFRTHRLLAIFIFTFATLQMLALRLRPKVGDINRKYWDIYHHFLGYALLAIIIMNIFHGISILQPKNITWKRAYGGILAILVLIAILLEIYTWVKFLKQRRKKPMYSSVQSPQNSPRVGNEHEASTSSLDVHRA